MFFEGNNRIYIAGEAWLLDSPRADIELATSDWAVKHMTPNDAYSYILGRFVEADRANGNKQYFRMGDLLLSQSTIDHAPMNINHSGAPVGTFVATSMQYPAQPEDHALIEALSVFWKAYYPDLHDKVKDAFAQAKLFYSMEAVPLTLSTIGGADDAAEYAYEGRTSPNYPVEINDRSCDAIVLNSPHFVGGALIIPPASPGWNKADVKQLSKFVTDQWEAAEQMYAGVQEIAPNEEPSVWEGVMNELILMAVEEGAVLDTKKRNNLPDASFAIPAKRAYPIHDLAHARNALARVAQHGTPAEQSQVRAAVYKKYPQLKKGK